MSNELFSAILAITKYINTLALRKSMKKGILLFIALIIASFSVHAASIEFGTGLKQGYNLGDTLTIGGRVSSEIARPGAFKLAVFCNEVQTPVVKSKQLNLDAGGEYVFTEEMMLPIGFSGRCYVSGSFDDAKKNSNTFTVSKELKGVFDISDTYLQLGSGFLLYGEVTKLNNANVEGAATISLTKDGQVYDVNAVSVGNGWLNYSYLADNIPAGKYSIDVNVIDAFGNEKHFVNAAGFEVYNDLKITAVVDKTEVLPGESLVVKGNVKYRNGELVNEKVRLVINEGGAELIEGGFSFGIDTSGRIKSGENSIMLKASDGHGNIGEGLMSFNVIPVPTRLVVNKNKQEYLPGDNVEINTYLYDQADDLIENDAVVNVKDADGEDVESGVGSLVFKLGEQAVPGEWEITASDDKLAVSDVLIVKEVGNLSVALAGQDVFLRNIGNIDFDGSVAVKVDEEALNQPLKLGLNESYTIKLDRFHGEKKVKVYVAGKEYDLGVVNIEDRRNFFGKLGDQLTGNVVGEEKATNPWMYVAVIGVLMGCLIGFYVYKKRTENYYEGLRGMERKEAGRVAERIRKTRDREIPRKRLFYSKPINPEDAKGFREQYLQRIKDGDGSASRRNNRPEPYEKRERYDGGSRGFL